MISDKTVEKLLGVLSRDIAQRTPGTGDFPTAVEGLQLFRRNETAPPVSCLVPPSIVLDHVGWWSTLRIQCGKIPDHLP